LLRGRAWLDRVGASALFASDEGAVQKKPRLAGVFSLSDDRLGRLDVGRLLAFGTGGHFKRDALVFLQGFEAVGFDFGEVREEVFAAAIGRDKTKTLGVIEPLYNTCLHLSFP
jgi:hypothetical protein